RILQAAHLDGTKSVCGSACQHETWRRRGPQPFRVIARHVLCDCRQSDYPTPAFCRPVARNRWPRRRINDYGTHCMTTLNELTLTELVGLRERGDLDPAALLDACIARIESREHEVQAFEHVDFERVRQALPDASS